MTMICYVDGGYDNINKRNGYGSFLIEERSQEGKLISYLLYRTELDVHSNNESEYAILLKLLFFLRNNNLLLNQEITILSDSQLVVNQVNGDWSIKSENLVPYYKEARALLKSAKGIHLRWIPREQIVKKLGH